MAERCFCEGKAETPGTRWAVILVVGEEGEDSADVRVRLCAECVAWVRERAGKKAKPRTREIRPQRLTQRQAIAGAGAAGRAEKAG